MSYNILVNSPRVSKTPRKRWDRRKELVVRHIKLLNPDLMALQECLPDQRAYLEEAFPSFQFYGEGSMGNGQGPQNPIIFKKGLFRLEDTQTFWLSETPQQPSKSWDSAHFRMCSYVKLIHEASNSVYFHFNTHLDHKGKTARLEGIKLIINKIEELQVQYPEACFILTGDFNANTQKAPYLEVKQNSPLKDSCLVAKEKSGADHSFSGIDKAWHPDKPLLFAFYKDFMHKRIDHLFVSKNITVNKYHISDWTEGKCYPSDHLPVLVDIQLQ